MMCLVSSFLPFYINIASVSFVDKFNLKNSLGVSSAVLFAGQKPVHHVLALSGLQVMLQQKDMDTSYPFSNDISGLRTGTGGTMWHMAIYSGF